MTSLGNSWQLEWQLTKGTKKNEPGMRKIVDNSSFFLHCSVPLQLHAIAKDFVKSGPFVAILTHPLRQAGSKVHQLLHQICQLFLRQN